MLIDNVNLLFIKLRGFNKKCSGNFFKSINILLKIIITLNKLPDYLYLGIWDVEVFKIEIPNFNFILLNNYNAKFFNIMQHNNFDICLSNLFRGSIAIEASVDRYELDRANIST